MNGRKWHDNSFNCPLTWFWNKGKPTNDKDGDREFIYFHFMYWKKEAEWLSINSQNNTTFPVQDSYAINKNDLSFHNRQILNILI